MNRNPTANHQLLSLPSGGGVFMADNMARVSVDSFERIATRTAFGLITCRWKFFQQVIQNTKGKGKTLEFESVAIYLL